MQELEKISRKIRQLKQNVQVDVLEARADCSEKILQLKSFDSSSKHAEIVSESFGIVVCRLAATVPDILGLVWHSFWPQSDAKSKTCGRILKIVRALKAQPRLSRAKL